MFKEYKDIIPVVNRVESGEDCPIDSEELLSYLYGYYSECYMDVKLYRDD